MPKRWHIALLCVFALFSGQVQAYCVGWDKTLPNYRPDYYSVEQEYRRAQYVAIVRVTGETWLGEDGKPKPLQPPFQGGSPRPWGFDPYIGAFYDVDVLQAYKGEVPKSLRLFSENSTARYRLEVDHSYLAFMSPDTDDTLGKVLSLDNCGNSVELTKSAKALKRVRALSRQSER